MKTGFNQCSKIVLIIVLMILFTTVMPAIAGLLDQSLHSTGLKSATADETNTSDVTAVMQDGLFDQGIRVQKSKNKYDILSFGLNIEAAQLSTLILSFYVNNLDAGGKDPLDGWGIQTARVYAYNVDGISVQSSQILEFDITHGWNNLDVKQLLALMDGFGFVKLRIVAVRNWFEIAEAEFYEINHSPVAVPNGPYSGIATKPVFFYQ